MFTHDEVGVFGGRHRCLGAVRVEGFGGEVGGGLGLLSDSVGRRCMWDIRIITKLRNLWLGISGEQYSYHKHGYYVCTSRLPPGRTRGIFHFERFEG
jgi:hypothetical protein